jgi:hypothetical protein
MRFRVVGAEAQCGIVMLKRLFEFPTLSESCSDIEVDFGRCRAGGKCLLQVTESSFIVPRASEDVSQLVQYHDPVRSKRQDFPILVCSGRKISHV